MGKLKESEKDKIRKELNKDILDQTSISLMVNSYEDIFSTFDPRSYDYKALSVDFLDEVRRATRDKNNQLEVFLLVPKKNRNFEKESHIRKRMFDHFKRHHDIVAKEIDRIKKKGWIMTISGILMIFLATLLFSYHNTNLFINFLIILFEPGGWFTAWTGLDEIYYTARSKEPDLEFNRKMAHATIHFASY
ncbi:hypothetical protein COU54_00205 [Candidatus Pacearchaeota archaeon CG10_big_fil_rev_8_21_14_0_10_31_24]|nr:MAG: hypothetical protein COU54_00205 [Candidatus Pacearchaeota archaeon CG10_big_fil_rev_8_21_14_0_10_31_24]